MTADSSSSLEGRFFYAKFDSSLNFQKLHFEYFKKGEGFQVSNGRVSILAQAGALMEPLSETQMIQYAKSIDTYLFEMKSLDTGKTSRKEVGNDTTNLKTIIQKPESFIGEEHTNLPFFKYLKKDHLNKYIKQDNFQLGTINYYHESDPNSQDVSEGFIHFFIDQFDKQRAETFYSGFNYLMFCGTYIAPDKPESEILKKNFGDCVIKIKDPNQFMKTVSNVLKSDEFYLKRVKYQPVKIFHTRFDEYIDNLDKGILSQKMFEFIQQTASIPSLFMKKNYCIREDGTRYYYENEYELRMVFKTPIDQSKPIQLKNTGLIDLIEIIQD